MVQQMIISALLQILAVALQLATVFLALRLIRVTGWKLSWLVISGALLFMAARRFYGLWLLIWEGAKPVVADAAAAAVISLLMLVGVASIKPLLQAIKRSEDNLRQTGKDLEQQVAARTGELQSAKEQLEVELQERRRAEAAVEAEQQRLYALLESLPALVYLKAPDYTIRFANRQFREDYGDPEGRRCYEVFGKSEVCQYCGSLKVLDTGTPRKEEWLRSEGDRVYELIHYPFRDLDGSPLVLTLGIDITERKQMEEALRQGEEKYRLLVNQIPALVFKGYPDWSVDFFDNKIETLTGYSKEDFDARRLKWCDLIPPEDLGYAAKVFRDALKSDGAYVREHRIIRKDKEIRWVQCWGQIFFDEHGKIDYINGVTFDVTARKQLEEILRQSEGSLRHLTSRLLTIQENERERIARELHDELGQSLLVLKMQLNALQRGGREEKPLEADYSEMLQALDEIMGNVRRLSRNLSPYILADLGLETALQRLLQDFSKYHHISLELSGDFAGLNRAFPAPEQIHIYRIFQECLTNVGKHSGASNLRVAVSRGEGEISFLLEDNGRGFDADAVQDAAAPGKGIGLATLRERARLLGGRLFITSVPDQGTRVSVVLPVKKQDDADLPGELDGPDVSAAGRTLS